eukprot:6184271-Pleurochrysis_carterae.AAC.4
MRVGPRPAPPVHTDDDLVGLVAATGPSAVAGVRGGGAGVAARSPTLCLEPSMRRVDAPGVASIKALDTTYRHYMLNLYSMFTTARY